MRQPYWDLYVAHGKKRPLWFDEAGVPRWVPFEPSLANNIYAKEVVLYELACQWCGRRYAVVDSWSVIDRMLRNLEPLEPLSTRVRHLYWGDAPCFQAEDGSTPYQCPGSTMTSESIRVLEFWKYEQGKWVRCPELEIEIPSWEAKAKEYADATDL